MGKLKMPEVVIKAACCVGCGECVKDCPEQNIALKDKKAVVQRASCLRCGHCVAICKTAAVSIPSLDAAEIQPVLEQHTLDPEKLLAAIKAGRSIRQFKHTPVEREKLLQIIEAGRFSATATNAQDVTYIVLTQRLSEVEQEAYQLFMAIKRPLGLFLPVVRNINIGEHFFFKEAPAAIIIKSRNAVNGTIAAANMELMAESLGLGTLYSGFFTAAVNISAKIRRMLDMRQGEKVVTVLVLGYPDVKYARTVSRKKPQIVFL